MRYIAHTEDPQRKGYHQLSIVFHFKAKIERLVLFGLIFCALAYPSIVNAKNPTVSLPATESQDVQANVDQMPLKKGDKYAVDFNGDQLINFGVNDTTAKTALEHEVKPAPNHNIHTQQPSSNIKKVIIAPEDASDIIDSVINTKGYDEATVADAKNGNVILTEAVQAIDVAIDYAIATAPKIYLDGKYIWITHSDALDITKLTLKKQIAPLLVYHDELIIGMNHLQIAWNNTVTTLEKLKKQPIVYSQVRSRINLLDLYSLPITSEFLILFILTMIALVVLTQYKLTEFDNESKKLFTLIRDVKHDADILALYNDYAYHSLKKFKKENKLVFIKEKNYIAKLEE